MRTATSPVEGRHPGGPSVGSALLVAVAVGFGVGALTAYGQGWLGDSTSSLANSAGPWSLAAFVVARRSRQVLPAVVAATATLACCEVGYVVATEVRGGANATSTVVFWLTAAVLAGPPLGVAAAWSTRGGLLGPVGLAAIGGVLVGEGAYGWSTVADTTDWRYWAAETSIGVVVVAIVVARSRRPATALAATGTAALAALVVFAAARAV
ncbi:MAG: DUF6518 family protein [Acidimicrobiia bacterium]